MSENYTYFLDSQKINQIDPFTWLQSKQSKPMISDLLQNLDWKTVNTIEKNQTKFEALIKERPFLMAQYRVQTAYLVQLSGKLDKYDPALAREIEKTLRMTVLLRKIYLHLDEPDDVMRAEIDVTILESILQRIKDPEAQHISNIPACNLGISNRLRAIHLGANLSRLTAIRIRRFILAAVALRTFLSWAPTVAQVEYFTAPFFLYLGWLFFLPRFALNLTTLLNKTFFSAKNKLPWSLKLEAYLNLHRRLYELWTDTAWFTSGILLCFVLFGPLAVWRPIAVISVQISDTIMMITRSFFELRRLFVLKNEYQEGIKNGLSEKNLGYLKALEERIAFEKKVSYLAITNNLLMTIALLAIIPSISVISPLIPILGATLGVLTTLRFYTYNTINESQQPKTSLNLILKNYDLQGSKTPTSVPPNLLLSRLAVPTVLVLTPLIFIGCTINPMLTALLCVSLVLIAIRKTQQPGETQKIRKNYDTIMNHHFFKSERAIEQPSEPQKSNAVTRTP